MIDQDGYYELNMIKKTIKINLCCSSIYRKNKMVKNLPKLFSFRLHTSPFKDFKTF